MKFSQRIGKSPVRSVMQIESMDEALKIRLWNLISENYLKNLHQLQFRTFNSSEYEFYLILWTEFYNNVVETMPRYQTRGFTMAVYEEEIVEYVRKWFFKSQWYEIYDFLEFLSDTDKNKVLSFDEFCNQSLKSELSGYRLIEGKVLQITTDEEVQEIEEAINETSKWKSVNTHLTTALNFLSDRKNPNYRNSIKESISAVEAFCVIITDNPKTSLGEALKEIEKKHSLHAALKKSFTSLYGYTSDSSGIRHSLLETDTDVDFEEAKFMLVSCSAFINFLKSKITI